jgi:hypothetical protein
MPSNYFYLFAACLLSVKYSWASSKNISDSPLQIKPITCVVKQIGQPCTMTVSLAWQHHSLINACLFQEDTKLRCWQQTNKVKEKLKVTLETSMHFKLIDSQGFLLATQTVQVNAALSKRFRRKLKTDWSFF